MSEKKKIKIGILSICLNSPYWSFASEMFWGLNTFFLKHHSIKDKYEIEYMLWSDIPENKEEIRQKMAEYLLQTGIAKSSIINEKEVFILIPPDKQKSFEDTVSGAINVRNGKITVFSTEAVEWPLPTLLRYNLFLQQEEYLNKFDYIFYIDVDMRIVDWISEEILGEGLTAAQHPMYAWRYNFQPPFEPNPESFAYIKLPGRLLEEKDKKRFNLEYYAGGFQGGKRDEFIKAMKVMRKNIDDDFNRNYIARWNDESHWNKYLFDNPPMVILSPSYIYPDSLISEYYVRGVWGRNYSPKIMTLTKSFTTNTEGGQAVREQLATM